MTNQESREVIYFKLPVFVVDMTLHLLVLWGLCNLLPKIALRDLGEHGHWSFTIYGLLIVSFCTSISIIGLKLHERRIKLHAVIGRAMLQTLAVYVMYIAMVALVYKVTPRHLVICQFIISLPLIIIWHTIANLGVKQLRKMGRNTRRVVMVGADVTNVRAYNELLYGRAFTGFSVAGFFSSDKSNLVPETSELLGSIDDSFDWIEKNKPDEVFCSLPPATCKNEVNKLIKICNDNFIEFYFVPTFDGYPKRHVQVRRLGQVNIIRLREEPMDSPLSKIVKRTVDVLVSGLFLCTLYPFVLLFVWLGNKITGNVGPLYFRQARTGYNGKSFRIYKFRSMKVNDQADTLQATKDDPRKTPFGDFLRKSSIDELPQFINVFFGDMSIIGPRPHMEHHTEVYSELIGNYMVRHLAKPGITGWAQVNGCRGETKTVDEMKQRVEHDIWYIEHWSLILDISIFFKTIWQVLPGHDKQAY